MMEDEVATIVTVDWEPLQINIRAADNGFVIESQHALRVALTLKQMLRAVADMVRKDEQLTRDMFAEVHEDAEIKDC